MRRRRAPMAALVALCAAVGPVTAAPPAADAGPSILQIFDRFTAVQAAAWACAEPDETTQTRFLANFLDVMVHAVAYLDARYPQLGRERVEAELKRRTQVVRRAAFGEIKRSGCDGDTVLTWLRLFEIYAEPDGLGRE